MIRVIGKVDLLDNINVMVRFERGWNFTMSDDSRRRTQVVFSQLSIWWRRWCAASRTRM